MSESLPHLNLRALYRPGQTVWIVAKYKRTPRIFERTIERANTTTLRLVGGFPDSWRDVEAISMWINREGMHATIVPQHIHTKLELAEKQLKYQIMEMMLKSKKDMLENLVEALHAPVLQLAEETDEEKHYRLRGHSNSLDNGKKRRPQYVEKAP